MLVTTRSRSTKPGITSPAPPAFPITAPFLSLAANHQESRKEPRFDLVDIMRVRARENCCTREQWRDTCSRAHEGSLHRAILRVEFLLLIAVPYHSVTYVLQSALDAAREGIIVRGNKDGALPTCSDVFLGLLYERCLVPYDDAFTWTLLSDLVASAHVHCEVNLC